MVLKQKLLAVSGIFLFSFLIFIGCVEEKSISTEHSHILLGAEETCVKCHANSSGLSPFHNPEFIGCSPCHLGDPYKPEKDLAHMGMIGIPGNFGDMHKTCGAANCHQDIPDRIQSSLMSTMAGVITVDRYVFGEEDTLSKYAHVATLGKESPADRHLRQLCASCHLGNVKDETGPVTELTRGGGCNACHLNYSKESYASHLAYGEDHDISMDGFVHPGLTVEVKNDHCFGCHSRSGRISTSYEGWHETTLGPEEISNETDYRLLQDGRVFEKINPDVHHQRGLECIDCHLSTEIMGDGKTYLHQDLAVKIRCIDCHDDNPQNRVSYIDLDPESKKLMGLRGMNDYKTQFATTSSDKTPFYNVVVTGNDSIIVVGKNSGQKHYSPPIGNKCADQAHTTLSCQSCHTSWTPQCIGCHNTYDPKASAYDLLDHQDVKGRWIEHLGEFFADPPALGVSEYTVEDVKIREVKTFISGMILSIDASGFPGKENDTTLHKRLFAPIDAHTTTRKARTCKSCHNDPQSLGYGRGKLMLNNQPPHWEFIADYIADDHDGLPQDAWIPFLKDAKGTLSTRPYTRPFSLEEQKKILNVGACLTCHKEDSEVMKESLHDFKALITRIADSCVIPFTKESR